MAFMPPAIFADAFAPRSLGVTSGAARRPFNSFFFASLIAMTVPRCARLKMQRRTRIVAPIEKRSISAAGSCAESAQESAKRRRPEQVSSGLYRIPAAGVALGGSRRITPPLSTASQRNDSFYTWLRPHPAARLQCLDINAYYLECRDPVWCETAL